MWDQNTNACTSHIKEHHLFEISEQPNEQHVVFENHICIVNTLVTYAAMLIELIVREEQR